MDKCIEVDVEEVKQKMDNGALALLPIHMQRLDLMNMQIFEPSGYKVIIIKVNKGAN